MNGRLERARGRACRRSRTLLTLALLALGIAVLFVAPAAQAAAPTVSSVQESEHHVLVYWSLPSGTRPEQVEVAKSSSTQTDGSFFDENVVDGVSFYDLSDTQTSWTSQKLEAGTYYVHVQGYDPADDSKQWSNIATVTIAGPSPPPPPPAAASTSPATISSVSVSQGHVLVYWSLPAGMTSFIVEVAGQPGTDSRGNFFSENVVASANTDDFDGFSDSDTSWTSSEALPNGLYYVHVADWNNAANEGAWSNVVSVRVGPPPDTTAPVIRALRSTGRVGRAAQLSFTLSSLDSPVTRERISVYRGSILLRAWTSPFATSKPGQTYYYPWTARQRGQYRFCIDSTDKAGNTSALSCAALIIR